MRHNNTQAIHESTTFQPTMLSFPEKILSLMFLELDVTRRFEQRTIVRCRKKVRVAG